MSDVNHVKLDISVLSYSVVFIKKMSLLSENFQAFATDVFLWNFQFFQNSYYKEYPESTASELSL